MSFFFFSCSSDDNDVNEEAVPEDEISVIDKQLLTQIKKAGKLFDTNEIWNDYKFSEMPLYLIHKNKNGKVDRGIIVNPQSVINEAIEINDESNQKLKTYRFDNEVDRAFKIITSEEGNGLYDFNFKINDEKYYIQVYTDDEVIAGEKLQAYPGGFFDVNSVTFGSIDFLIHENFHTFQELTFKKSAIIVVKEFKGQRNSNELLELRTLMHQIFKNFPNGNLNKSALEEKLKQYVAIRSKQLESSSYNLTETREGTARYIEKMALRSIFPERASEPFIEGTVLENEYGIKSKQILNDVFNFQLSYEIGASACYALNTVNRNVLDDINTGKSIYEVAKKMFNMNDTELAKHLEKAKESVDWKAIQTKVLTWNKLK